MEWVTLIFLPVILLFSWIIGTISSLWAIFTTLNERCFGLGWILLIVGIALIVTIIILLRRRNERKKASKEAINNDTENR